MERKFYAIVSAGGTGTRMGAGVPKQFLRIGGKPILRLTIERIMEAIPEASIVTVLPAEHMDYWRSCCQAEGFNCPQRLVEGGFTRFHSVKNAMAVIPDGAIVAVHDGVRPLASVQLWKRMLSEMDSARALIPVMPSTDTLKVLSRGADGVLRSSGQALDRTLVYGAQTPQMFRSEDLRAAYSEVYDTAFTDDASVAERHGIALSYTMGERTNIKITTPEDLALAEAILQICGR